MGMTYDQFWNQDCQLVKYYKKAAKIKRELKNEELWLQGVYIYEALIDVAPMYRSYKPEKPKPYAEHPYELFPKPEDKKEQENKDKMLKTKEHMEAIAMAVNKKFEESKGGEVSG